MIWDSAPEQSQESVLFEPLQGLRFAASRIARPLLLQDIHLGYRPRSSSKARYSCQAELAGSRRIESTERKPLARSLFVCQVHACFLAQTHIWATCMSCHRSPMINSASYILRSTPPSYSVKWSYSVYLLGLHRTGQDGYAIPYTEKTTVSETDNRALSCGRTTEAFRKEGCIVYSCNSRSMISAMVLMSNKLECVIISMMNRVIWKSRFACKCTNARRMHSTPRLGGTGSRVVGAVQCMCVLGRDIRRCFTDRIPLAKRCDLSSLAILTLRYESTFS